MSLTEAQLRERIATLERMILDLDDVGPDPVDCEVCGRQKNPRGRSAPFECGGYCESECPGNWKDPKPSDLWSGEKRSDFGYGWNPRKVSALVRFVNGADDDSDD